LGDKINKFFNFIFKPISGLWVKFEKDFHGHKRDPLASTDFERASQQTQKAINDAIANDVRIKLRKLIRRCGRNGDCSRR